MEDSELLGYAVLASFMNASPEWKAEQNRKLAEWANEESPFLKYVHNGNVVPLVVDELKKV
jgi:hypothetical protein